MPIIVSQNPRWNLQMSFFVWQTVQNQKIFFYSRKATHFHIIEAWTSNFLEKLLNWFIDYQNSGDLFPFDQLIIGAFTEVFWYLYCSFCRHLEAAWHPPGSIFFKYVYIACIMFVLMNAYIYFIIILLSIGLRTLVLYAVQTQICDLWYWAI